MDINKIMYYNQEKIYYFKKVICKIKNNKRIVEGKMNEK